MLTRVNLLGWPANKLNTVLMMNALFEKLDCLRLSERSRARKKKLKVKSRKTRGNMIALMSAVTLGLVLAVLFFALKYTRMLGSSQEQRTAIEGAALQTANDISRIVYEDPNFGFVAISDFAPIGYDTTAADKQLTPVRGINTILGTVRLDMIIADQLGNAEMQTLAQKDYQNALSAVTTLQSQIADACLPTPQSDHRDWDGNIIHVYQDAVAAYNQNIIRMSGTQSALDPNSVKITLGILQNGASTNTAIPAPSTMASVTSDQTKVETINNQVVTCYKSYVDATYTNTAGTVQTSDFVFCGADNSLKLVDINQFTTTIAPLPYALTSVVKVEGDQVYQGDNASAPSTRVHSIACAQPASAGDPRPFPGALTIGFPNGAIPEITSPNDILTKPIISTIPMKYSTSNTGDVGTDPVTPPITYPSVGTTGALGGYHWLRRAGTRPNISSVVSAFAAPFGTGAAGTIYLYNFDATGTAQITSVAEPTSRQMMQSNHQLVAKTVNNMLSSNGNTYGMAFTDLVAFEGSTYGGTHAGEPLLGNGPTLDGTGTSQMVGATAIGGLLGLIAALVSAIFSLIFGTPPITTPLWTPAVRSTHVVVPPPAATTRNPRDTYTQQGLAVDMEFPQVTTVW